MGVIRPPWVSKKFFNSCPFNFCDHFGDESLLAKVCIICRDRLREKRGEPVIEEERIYIMGDGFETRTQSLPESNLLTMEEVEEINDIGWKNIPLEEQKDKAPPLERFPIYNLVERYCDDVKQVIKVLAEIYPRERQEVIFNELDILDHGHHYARRKIRRALSSRWREERSYDFGLNDSKTAAFFAYVSVIRNGRSLDFLVKNRSLESLAKYHQKTANQSLKIAEEIRGEFFPTEQLVYHEYGFVYHC